MFVDLRTNDVQESDGQAIVNLVKVGASDIPVFVSLVVSEVPFGARGECGGRGGGEGGEGSSLWC